MNIINNEDNKKAGNKMYKYEYKEKSMVMKIYKIKKMKRNNNLIMILLKLII